MENSSYSECTFGRFSSYTAVDIHAAAVANHPTEEQIKSLLWTPILTHSVASATKLLYPAFEFCHLFRGSGGLGSGFSDVSFVTKSSGGSLFAVLVVEFQAADAETHKDEVTCSAEAVYELQRILSEARGLTKEEVKSIKVHMAIAGGHRIKFFTLRATTANAAYSPIYATLGQHSIYMGPI